MTVGTARLAVVLYLARWLLRAGRVQPVPSAIEAALWTCGAAVFLGHVAAAFQFYHGWSHAAAYEHTARRTADLIGLNWGGGLFLNYVFAVWWPADAVAVCMATHRNRRIPRRYGRATDLFFGFMMLNATVVFGPRWWLAVGVLALIAYFAIRRRRHDISS